MRVRIAILLVFVCAGAWSATALGEATRFEPRVSLLFPYFFEPIPGNGDTTLGAGLDFQIRPQFLVSQGFTFGLLGRHRIRYEAGPMLRIFPDNSFSGQFYAGGIAEFRPQGDGGFSGRLGVSWDASRATRIWHVRISLESGLAVFLRRPRTLEWQVARLSLVFPF